VPVTGPAAFASPPRLYSDGDDGVGHTADSDPDTLAEDLRWRVVNCAVRERAATRAAAVEPPLTQENLPEYLRPLVASRPSATAAWIADGGTPMVKFPAIFRSFTIPDWSMRWQIYFYRFVNPRQRTGPKINYADRVRRARAWVTRYGATIYVSPPPAAQDASDQADK
jgi:hypothetical protein